MATKKKSIHYSQTTIHFLISAEYQKA